jgi:predicted GIY-YIG superfamily endonuclease
MRRERVIKAMPRARKIRLIEERGGETVGKKRARARRSRRQSG